MNLLKEFNESLTIDEYENFLGDQLPLHQLHYGKADTGEYLTEDIPELKLLVITEPWCGDSTAILPVLLKLFEDKPVEFRVALRDQNTDLIDRFLTRGGRAIPIILILDSDGEFLTRFGPRPKNVQEIYELYRPDIQSGKIEKIEVSKKIRNFYAKDRGKSILDEFTHMLNMIIAENMEINA
ncbi:MAG: thioredoxin family protein [Calditrichaceae bacterium]